MSSFGSVADAEVEESMTKQPVVVEAPTSGPIPDDGRVASQTVLHTTEVRVVEIAFGSGGQLTEHSAPVPIIVQALEGVVDFEVSGTTHRLSAPGFVYLPTPGERHRVVAERPARIQITMLLAPGVPAHA